MQAWPETRDTLLARLRAAVAGALGLRFLGIWIGGATKTLIRGQVQFPGSVATRG